MGVSRLPAIFAGGSEVKIVSDCRLLTGCKTAEAAFPSVIDACKQQELIRR